MKNLIVISKAETEEQFLAEKCAFKSKSYDRWYSDFFDMLFSPSLQKAFFRISDSANFKIACYQEVLVNAFLGGEMHTMSYKGFPLVRAKNVKFCEVVSIHAKTNRVLYIDGTGLWEYNVETGRSEEVTTFRAIRAWFINKIFKRRKQ